MLNVTLSKTTYFYSKKGILFIFKCRLDPIMYGKDRAGREEGREGIAQYHNINITLLL